jgi:GAF domain-containing protein
MATPAVCTLKRYSEMVHSLCTTEQSNPLSHVQRLWSTVFASDVELEQKLERLFAEETDEFGMEGALFSRIDLDEETEQFEVVYGPHEDLTADATVPLSSTYCRKTITEPTGTMTVSDAPAEGWSDDPAYQRFGFGSYVGTTVRVDDELYGTLCFVKTAPRDQPIVDAEARLVELYGQWAAYELDQRRDTSADVEIETSDGPLVASSSQLDTVMDILSRQARRRILLTLVDDTTENSVRALERAINEPNPRIQLYHVHLPRLEQADYIEWDRDSNTITRGKNFSEVESLLGLLSETTMDVSE